MAKTESTVISRTQATKAGRVIAQFSEGNPKYSETDYSQAIETLQTWRGQFLRPTENAFSCLIRDANQEAVPAVASYRLKRQTSIVKKLCRKHSHHKLGELDDIGGCRLIVNNLTDLRRIVTAVQHDSQLGDKGLTKHKNYILTPEKSGYRSYHYLSRIANPEDPGKNYRVEIQIRTFLEHYWATALETFSEISGINLKDPEILDHTSVAPPSKIKAYQTIFAYISQLFALQEGTGLISGIPTNEKDIKSYLQDSPVFRTIIDELSAAQGEVSAPPQASQTSSAKLFLLEFSPDDQMINVQAFSNMGAALEAYDESENPNLSSKDAGKDTKQKGTGEDVQTHHELELSTNTVLAYANGRDNLERAYPNYRLDQRHFLEALQRFDLK